MAWKPKRLLWLETVVKANEFVNHDRHRRQSSCIFTATSTDTGPRSACSQPVFGLSIVKPTHSNQHFT